MLKILSVDNISARAFRLAAPAPWGVAAFASPRIVEAETAAGNCDASLLPVPCVESLAELVEPVGEFGIACTGPVSSVLLLSNVESETLARRSLPIGVTSESCTSRRLLRMLFRMEFGREPELVEPGHSPHARLVIGDKAYREGVSLEEGWRAVDLCEWWNALTGRPFVFARWTVRRGLSVAARDRILDWLEMNASLAESPFGAQLRFDPEQTPFVSVDAAKSYYANLRHRLSPADLEATRFFHDSCKESIECTLSA